MSICVFHDKRRCEFWVLRILHFKAPKMQNLLSKRHTTDCDGGDGKPLHWRIPAHIHNSHIRQFQQAIYKLATHILNASTQTHGWEQTVSSAGPPCRPSRKDYGRGYGYQTQPHDSKCKNIHSWIEDTQLTKIRIWPQLTNNLDSTSLELPD